MPSMTTVHARPAASSSVPAEPEPQVNVITLEGVSWELYERLSEELSAQRVRLTYDDGTLTLTSPILSRHERIKSLLARIVEAATEERNLPIATLGSTTWKKKKLRKALEPDEC